MLISQSVWGGQLKSTVVNCIAIDIQPTVKNKDELPATDEQKGLALLESFRSIQSTLGGSGKLVLSRNWGRGPNGRCTHRFPIKVRVNDEELLSIEIDRKIP